MSRRTVCLSVCTVAALVAAGPTAASAQSVGLGPRFSFVRSDLPTATSSTHLFGGTLRLKSSKHIAFEAALDYHSEFSEDKTTRIRQKPFQMSLLVFPARSAFSPYLLGGFGI